MTKFIGSWSFYKKALVIAIPIMVQNLITNFVALIDNIMVGQVGTEQMSGVAIANQVFFVFNLTIFGALSGAGIFCAQFFGKDDYEGVRNTFRYRLITVSSLTAGALLIFLFFGGNLTELYLHGAEGGADPILTQEYAQKYMRIMLWGLVPFSAEQIYSNTLREGRTTMPPMVAGIVAVALNTLLNFLLIFGIGFFPELGVEGAAIATVISRYVQAGIVIVWTHLHAKKLVFAEGLYKTLRIPRALVKTITLKGFLPLLTNEFLWAAGVAALVSNYSLRGIDAIAGLNIANTVINLFNVLFIAFGSGVSVVIGQLLGANKLKEAKESTPKLIFFAGAMCVVIGGAMACFAQIFPLAYNTTDDVRGIASTLIVISAAMMPICSMLHSMYFIIRSGGKTLITFMFDSGFSWCVSVPVSFILAHFTDLPVVWLYLCCQSVELLKCAIGFVLIKKGVWLSNIVDKAA